MNDLDTLKSTLDDAKVVCISTNGIATNCNTNQPTAIGSEEDSSNILCFYSSFPIGYV